jgi:hypothetical protein
MTGPIYTGRHEPDTSHERELDDACAYYTVVSGIYTPDSDPACQDFTSFPLALQAYRDKRAFMLSRECPLSYELDMLPPTGVMLNVGQLNKMFDDSVPRGYLEQNPSGKAPTTCGHGRAATREEDGRQAHVCLVCSHKWHSYSLEAAT